MKFHDLEIGQRFEHEGVAYVKTSPVLAGQADGGGSKFMPRYVMVKLLDDAAPRAKSRPEKALPAGAVLAAFEDYDAACRKALVRHVGDLPGDRLAALTAEMDAAKRGFLGAIGN
ncbi:MAG: hypothetical protein ACM3JK_02980 [Betaproteobacteria bacterium]